MRKTIFLAILLLFPCVIFAQTLPLSQSDKEEFKGRVEEMVRNFGETIAILPDFDKDFIKDKVIESTLSDFSANATIQIAYLNRANKLDTIRKKYKASDYLYGLKKYAKIPDRYVTFEMLDFNVDNLQPHPTDLGVFIAKFTFTQKISKCDEKRIDNEGIVSYGPCVIDITEKSGEARILRETNAEGTTYYILFYEINADRVEIYTVKE